MWRNGREFAQSLYAELHATLRNTALGLGFKAPDGKHWSAEMFMPGYAATASGPGEWDWKAEQTRMKAIGKRPDLTAVRAARAARSDFRARSKAMDAAKARGATKEELRLIMEA